MNRRIEELSLGSWPSLQTEVYDGWILRFAEGYSKRSNSVSPLYGSTIEIGEKIEYCEARYRGRDLPTIFKMLDAEEQETLDGILSARGYRRIDETSVQVLDLRQDEGTAAGGIELRDTFDAAWLDGYCACSRNGGHRDIIRRILGNLLSPAIVASASVEGRIAGCGYGALEQSYVGVFDIIVDKGMRLRGLGEGIVRAILGKAREKGARLAYLQVVAGNDPAENLYTKIGFREAHRYWYRTR